MQTSGVLLGVEKGPGMTNDRPAKGPERFLTYGVGNRLAVRAQPQGSGNWNQHGPNYNNLISRVIRGGKEDNCAATVEDICTWTGNVFRSEEPRVGERMR